MRKSKEQQAQEKTLALLILCGSFLLLIFSNF